MKRYTKVLLLALFAGCVTASLLDAANRKRGRPDYEGETYDTHPDGDGYNSEGDGYSSEYDYPDSDEEEGARQEQKRRNPAGTEDTPTAATATEAGPAGAGTGAGAGADDGTGGGSSMAPTTLHASGAASGTVGTALLRPHPIPAKPLPGTLGFLLNRQTGRPIRPVGSTKDPLEIITKNLYHPDQATRGAAFEKNKRFFAHQQRSYVNALAAAREALPARITHADAQIAFDALTPEEYLLRLAYQFIWATHANNGARTNLDPAINIAGIVTIPWHSIKLNFASLDGNPAAETLQQQLIHFACASNISTSISLCNIQPYTKPLEIFSLNLTDLFATSNQNLRNTTLVLPNLRYLSVCDCRYLTRIPSLPSLIELYAHSCVSLTTIPDLPNLRHLDANNCVSLTTIPDLPNLQSLSVCDCRYLTRIPSLPNLTELYANLSISLTTIPSLPNLRRLHINGCRYLTRIPSLPNLTELYAGGCTGLIEHGALPSLWPDRMAHLNDVISANRARIARNHAGYNPDEEVVFLRRR